MRKKSGFLGCSSYKTCNDSVQIMNLHLKSTTKLLVVTLLGKLYFKDYYVRVLLWIYLTKQPQEPS